MNKNIKRELENILEEKIEQLEICSRLDWKNIVYYCRTLKKEYAIKVFKKINNDEIRFNTELEMYKKFKKIKISTPEIIYSGRLGRENIIITQWINGISIKNKVNKLGIEENSIRDILEKYEKIWNCKDKELYEKLLQNKFEDESNPSMILTRINFEIDIFKLENANKIYLNKINNIKKYYNFFKDNIKIEYNHIINSDISMHEIIIKNNKDYWIDLESFTIGDVNNDLAGIFYSLSNSIYNRANEINRLERVIKNNKYYKEEVFIFYLIERVFCANLLDKSIKIEEMYYFIDYIDKIIQSLNYEFY